MILSREKNEKNGKGWEMYSGVHEAVGGGGGGGEEETS